MDCPGQSQVRAVECLHFPCQHQLLEFLPWLGQMGRAARPIRFSEAWTPIELTHEIVVPLQPISRSLSLWLAWALLAWLPLECRMSVGGPSPKTCLIEPEHTPRNTSLRFLEKILYRISSVLAAILSLAPLAASWLRTP